MFASIHWLHKLGMHCVISEKKGIRLRKTWIPFNKTWLQKNSFRAMRNDIGLNRVRKQLCRFEREKRGRKCGNNAESLSMYTTSRVLLRVRKKRKRKGGQKSHLSSPLEMTSLNTWRNFPHVSILPCKQRPSFGLLSPQCLSLTGFHANASCVYNPRGSSPFEKKFISMRTGRRGWRQCKVWDRLVPYQHWAAPSCIQKLPAGWFRSVLVFENFAETSQGKNLSKELKIFFWFASVSSI